MLQRGLPDYSDTAPYVACKPVQLEQAGALCKQRAWPNGTHQPPAMTGIARRAHGLIRHWSRKNEIA
jgi:hypothetical protein